LTINISGTLDDIKRQLTAISAVIQYRKYYGWAPFQSDENWLYESEQDDRVCPICQGFEAQQYYSGDAIPHEFPTREQIDPLHYVHPRVHQFYPELRGICRCSLIWLDAIITLAERLRVEMEDVTE